MFTSAQNKLLDEQKQRDEHKKYFHPTRAHEKMYRIAVACASGEENFDKDKFN